MLYLLCSFVCFETVSLCSPGRSPGTQKICLSLPPKCGMKGMRHHPQMVNFCFLIILCNINKYMTYIFINGSICPYFLNYLRILLYLGTENHISLKTTFFFFEKHFHWTENTSKCSSQPDAVKTCLHVYKGHHQTLTELSLVSFHTTSFQVSQCWTSCVDGFPFSVSQLLANMH